VLSDADRHAAGWHDRCSGLGRPVIELPTVANAYEYENGFYLTCTPGRIGKLLAHHELYQRAKQVPGAYVECGVFKGASFARFAAFRQLFELAETRQLIGFDTFAAFPEAGFESDRPARERFVGRAGAQSIATDQLRSVLARNGCLQNVLLVEGDICETVPRFVTEHPQLRIALLHLDVDMFEPSQVVMDQLVSRVVNGGVVILDDYGIFPGATEVVDAYMAARPERLQKLPYALAPAYFVKGEAR
jgi:hypothetical protein